MNKFYLTGAAAVAVLMTAAPAVAAPNLIVNGGFQTGVTNNGGFSTISAVSSVIPGWTVTAGSVDLITGYWQGANGTFASVDLAGNSNGTLSQTVETVVGQAYKLVFYKSANPDGNTAPKVVQVSITGRPAQNFTFFDSNQTTSNMKWLKTGTWFHATSTSTILSFAAVGNNAGPAGPGFYGLALDGVALTAATPEPEAFASILVGLGLAGFVARRRRAKAALVAA